MTLDKNFPKDPFEILDPEIRWTPDTRESQHLLSPLVQKIRKEVANWRKAGYPDISGTSKSLLNWWFKREHYLSSSDGYTKQFQYYFA